MNQVQTLERLAIDAHHRGETFTTFWKLHWADVAQAVPRDRFSGFYKRLLCLCVAGDLDSQEPIGSLECGWERDDVAAKPDDVATNARWRGLPQEVEQ